MWVLCHLSLRNVMPKQETYLFCVGKPCHMRKYSDMLNENDTSGPLAQKHISLFGIMVLGVLFHLLYECNCVT